MASRAQSNTTTDHDQIRQWAEARGAQPACVKGTGDSGDIGILRLDFPGYSGEESLQHIAWEDFFEKFDERGLALLYQEQTADGAKSNFNKLVNRTTAASAGRGSSRSARSSRGKSSGAAKKSAGKKVAARTSPAKKSAGKAAGRSAAKKAAGRSAAKKAAGRSAAKKTAGSRGSSSRAAKSSSRGSASTKRSAAKKSASGGRSGASGRSGSRRTTTRKSR